MCIKGVNTLFELYPLCNNKHISGLFFHRWLSSSRPFPKALLPEPSIEFQLRHVVALYEGLEDLLAEPAADTLRDAYRISLPHDLKNGELISVRQ